MLIREEKALPPCDPRPRCLAVGESEEGGAPVPLVEKMHVQCVSDR